MYHASVHWASVLAVKDAFDLVDSRNGIGESLLYALSESADALEVRYLCSHIIKFGDSVFYLYDALLYCPHIRCKRTCHDERGSSGNGYGKKSLRAECCSYSIEYLRESAYACYNTACHIADIIPTATIDEVGHLLEVCQN